MLQDKVVGIIGGHGWMGRSLGVALLEENVVPACRLIVSSRSGSGTAYQDWPDVRCVKENHELIALADVIILSVRPEDLHGLDIKAYGKLVVSLLAMVSAQEIATRLGSQRVVRAMPNAAVEIRRAYFPWYASEQVTAADKQLVQTFLESCGTARELTSEHDLDYMTALSGAGPAYPAFLAQSMLEHARQMGITDEIAFEAVMQTLVGGSLLLEWLGSDPGDMVERLIAYDGITAKGLRTMREEGISHAIHCGLNAAHRAATASNS